MSSIEAPIAPARTPLAPRIVELLSGDWRYVPILTAIVLIWILFGVWDPKFLSPRNLSNLSLQSVVTGILALGLVPVLIIRQIDMSVAAVSAVAGTITGQMLIVFDAPVWLAIGAGVAFGAAVGFVQGRWITWTKTPGFLVTFGVSLILAAVQLRLLPTTGQINLFGTDLTFLAGSYVDKSLSWALVLLAVAGFAVFRYLYVSDAIKAGLPVTVLKNVVAPTAIVLLVMAIAVGGSQSAQRSPCRRSDLPARDHRPVLHRLAYAVWRLSLCDGRESERRGPGGNQGGQDPNRGLHDLRSVCSLRRDFGSLASSRCLCAIVGYGNAPARGDHGCCRGRHEPVRRARGPRGRPCSGLSRSRASRTASTFWVWGPR